MATITVHFRLYSILKQYGLDKGLGEAFSLSVEEGTTLERIMERVGIPPKRVGRYLRQGRTMQPHEAPADGDVIDVLPPTISGG